MTAASPAPSRVAAVAGAGRGAVGGRRAGEERRWRRGAGHRHGERVARDVQRPGVDVDGHRMSSGRRALTATVTGAGLPGQRGGGRAADREVDVAHDARPGERGGDVGSLDPGDRHRVAGQVERREYRRGPCTSAGSIPSRTSSCRRTPPPDCCWSSLSCCRSRAAKSAAAAPNRRRSKWSSGVMVFSIIGCVYGCTLHGGGVSAAVA